MARAIAAVSLSIWVWLACFRGRFWQLRERLMPASEEPSNVSVTAVIPARDEARSIGRAVASLKAQQFGGALRVIVADDQSSDGTGEFARAAGADWVISVNARPSGWNGKLWAVHSGICAETGAPDYFLLTDADIEHASPASLSSLVTQAERGFDLVSVMVRLRSQSRAEKLLIPAFVFFFFKLYPPAWIASTRRTAAAAGGCMLIRRETLSRIGGIESIRSALIDDCALARRVKDAGGRVWLGISPLAIQSLREYGRAADVRAMIARSAFAQLNHSTLLLIGTVCGMLVSYVAPPLLLLSGDSLTVTLGASTWLLSAALFLPTVRAYEAPLWTAICLPGIGLFYLLATIESAVRYWTGRGGEWKGRLQDTGPVE
jgi:hopene-associated glycosyltransferase HpnB